MLAGITLTLNTGNDSCLLLNLSSASNVNVYRLILESITVIGTENDIDTSPIYDTYEILASGVGYEN